jgi:superoxide dismutase, Fe-Mn family
MCTKTIKDFRMLCRVTPKAVRVIGRRALSSEPQVARLPDIDYDYHELEPFISGEIMELHHSKHHNTYVTNYNATVEKYLDAEAKEDIATMISLQPAINFNGGGHVNHSLFWKMMAPPGKGGGGEPTGGLAKAIDSRWGSFEKFKAEFNAKAAGVQGSGWCWLGYNEATGGVEIATRSNQDPLTDLVPLVGADVWEHAYYLQYKNVRPDYLKAFWEVANMDYASQTYDSASN